MNDRNGGRRSFFAQLVHTAWLIVILVWHCCSLFIVPISWIFETNRTKPSLWWLFEKKAAGPMDIIPSSKDELHWEPRGLLNLGNTCFFNSVIQVLLLIVVYLFSAFAFSACICAFASQNLCRADSFLLHLRRATERSRQVPRVY